jgi:signal transduction histidine kinase
VDVDSLIEEAVALLRDDLKSHRISVEVGRQARLPGVIGDRVQLQQVLLNLITNAIDAMANVDGSRVLIVGSNIRDDGSVLISVADTGTGIDPQDVQRVFDPLFTTKSGGMGMGLAICRSIIEAHNGMLWVTPNTPQGSIFQFALSADAASSGGTVRPQVA